VFMAAAGNSRKVVDARVLAAQKHELSPILGDGLMDQAAAVWA
jgi:hypothetical protein